MPAPLASEVRRAAQRAGISSARWLGEVAEAYLAGERCDHGARPEAPTTEAPEPDE
jgi:hypothetical protein